MLRHSEASDYHVSIILPVEELNVSKLSTIAWYLKPPRRDILDIILFTECNVHKISIA